MRVLFLTKYGRRAASSRLRYLQYLPELERLGFACDVEPLFPDEYLERRFGGESVSIHYVLERLWRRLRIVLSSRTYDVVVLQYEMFPYLPAWVEALIRTRTPYVVDLDDAIFHGYDSNPRAVVRALLKHKIRDVIKSAAYVLAGSPYLVDYARSANPNVAWSPTCIDIDRFPVKQWSSGDGSAFTIGWIGAPSSVHFASDTIPAIRRLASRIPVRLVFVGSGPVSYEGLSIEVRDWAESTEVSSILDFDVGIMPLPDTPWAKGKCSFKLIQYMACGLPVVASPVGMNGHVVRHGINGYHAATTGEWLQAFEQIAMSVPLRAKLGREGRRLVEREFTTRNGIANLLHALKVATGDCTTMRVAC